MIDQLWNGTLTAAELEPDQFLLSSRRSARERRARNGCSCRFGVALLAGCGSQGHKWTCYYWLQMDLLLLVTYYCLAAYALRYGMLTVLAVEAAGVTGMGTSLGRRPHLGRGVLYPRCAHTRIRHRTLWTAE